MATIEEIMLLAAFMKATNENFKVIQESINDYQKQLTEHKTRIITLEKELKAIKEKI